MSTSKMKYWISAKKYPFSLLDVIECENLNKMAVLTGQLGGVYNRMTEKDLIWA